MARADSTIRVNIIGDAKGLGKELGKAEKGISGFGKKALGLGAALGIGVAASELIDFTQTALNEADRLGDATKRLELSVGGLADELVASAGGFVKLGQSTQDVLELEAAFADTATALQLSDENIVKFADDAAATAAAVALLGDQEADAVLDLIGKAAGGSAKALKALGISVTDAEIATRALADTGKTNADQLTASELAAASYALVLEALKPKLDAVATGTGDVEQKQAELQARFEDLTGKIGEGVEGPLNDFLAWVLAGVDGLGQLDFGIAEVMNQMKLFLGPLGQAIDGLGVFVDLLRNAASLAGSFGGFSGGSVGSKSGQIVVRNSDRNTVNAVNDQQSLNGRPIL